MSAPPSDWSNDMPKPADNGGSRWRCSRRRPDCGAWSPADRKKIEPITTSKPGAFTCRTTTGWRRQGGNDQPHGWRPGRSDRNRQGRGRPRRSLGVLRRQPEAGKSRILAPRRRQGRRLVICAAGRIDCAHRHLAGTATARSRAGSSTRRTPSSAPKRMVMAMARSTNGKRTKEAGSLRSPSTRSIAENRTAVSFTALMAARASRSILPATARLSSRSSAIDFFVFVHASIPVSHVKHKAYWPAILILLCASTAHGQIPREPDPTRVRVRIGPLWLNPRCR